MRSPDCAVCHRLWSQSARLLSRYNAALDAVTITHRLEQAYVDRWIDLGRAAELLFDAQRLEQLHHDAEHQSDREITRSADGSLIANQSMDRLDRGDSKLHQDVDATIGSGD
jgi:hypothetical protein